ncbi:MAG: acylneuraminate cytidylyltransferase [Cyclobacteriaceae bacterium]|nr:MAG: acylneuraminate cytidylyltransferase [Cyclobacteriaceae bacterium]
MDRVILATDCVEIESCVKGFGFSKISIFHRVEENARDTSSTEDVMLEYLKFENPDKNDLLFLVQATNPFSTSKDFDTAVDLLNNTPIDSLLSCSRVKRFLWTEQGKPLNYQYEKRPRRQDFPGTMMENGAFYLNTVSSIVKHRNRLSGNIGIYEMPAFAALELDEEDDWQQGEYLMKKYLQPKPNVKDIRLFLSDVDGVLTDAGMYYTENGDELKKFNTYDGMGFKLLQELGIKVGIVTKEDRDLNRRRAEKLKLDYHFHGVDHKLKLVSELCTKLGISLKEVAYIGDDINDQELLRSVGLAACPSNARKVIQSIPGITLLETPGGKGAVREFVELLWDITE